MDNLDNLCTINIDIQKGLPNLMIRVHKKGEEGYTPYATNVSINDLTTKGLTPDMLNTITEIIKTAIIAK